MTVPRKESVRLHPTAMSAHMSLTLRILGRLFFRQVRFDEPSADIVRRASRRGSVVYILRDRSIIDYLFFNWAYLALGLPLARFSNGLGGVILHPFRALFRLLTGRGREQGDGLTTTIERDGDALLFLRKPQTLTARDPEFRSNHVLDLIRLQRKRERPILLVPQLLLWTRAPERYQKSMVDIVFGDADAPGLLRGLYLFFRNRKRAFTQLAAPIDLQEVLARFPAQTDEVIAKKVRWMLLHYLTRERQTVLGPVMKSPARIREEVMRHKGLRATIAELAEKTQRAPRELEKQARKLAREIGADLSMRAIHIYSWLLGVVFSRMYNGIEVDEEGMARVREAMRRGPVILVPCHRSHVDYLLLSHLFYVYSLVPPHIAAGKNLSFWPMGYIFRKGGAFFLRRSFKGDPLYTAVFRAYLQKVLREGHTMEFFIEGGRSRTGKMLFPKTGLLSIVADALLDGQVRDVSLVPIHIGYQKILEASSYNKELMGGKKEKESIKGLLSVPKKVFRAKYGRVYVDFAEPIPLAAFAASRGFSPEAPPMPEPERRALVKSLAFRITHDITRVARASSSALSAAVLLGEGRRGVSRENFLATAHRLRDLLRQKHVRLPKALSGPAADAALDEAIKLLEENRLVEIRNQGDTIVYTVPEGARLQLDYYKNGIMHAFVSESIVACAMLAEPSGVPSAAHPVGRVPLRERARALSRVLKYEFVFRPGVEFDALFDDAVEMLQKQGIIAGGEAGLYVVPARYHDARLFGGFIEHFVESYAFAARGLAQLQAEPQAERALLQSILEISQKAFLVGDLKRFEAASKLIFENALRYFRDEGVLAGVSSEEEGDKGLVQLSAGYATPEALDVLESSLRALLPRPE